MSGPLLTARKPDLCPFFTVRTLADYLNVSQRTVYDLVEKREIPSYRVRRAVRIAARDVDAFLAARRDGRRG